MFPYDTLIGKESAAVERELLQVSGALATTCEQATGWLSGRLAPRGPVAADRSVSLVYKTLWAFESIGCTDQAFRLLDWLSENALRDSGDLYFAEEPEFERDGLRGYRQYVILATAGRVGHRLASEPRVLERMRQYQDPASGAGCLFVGTESGSPEYPDHCVAGYTAFLGECALAVGELEIAEAAADALVAIIDQNAPFFADGRFFYTTDRTGKLLTEHTPATAWAVLVDHRSGSQFGWIVGACMAFLADFYDAMACAPDVDLARAARYLNAALVLADFENGAPLETYFYPSKCKIAWGAGRLLSVLASHDLLTVPLADNLYRMGKRTFVYTFAGNQRSDGSWPACFFPTDATGPEAAFDYRVIKGLDALPEPAGYVSKTCGILSDVEITAEFLAEMTYLREGLDTALLAAAASPRIGDTDGSIV